MWGERGGGDATDLAECLGDAYGLSLLLHIPLLAGMAVTAPVTYGLLLMHRGGFRPIELLIGALVAVIALRYVVELGIAPVDWAGVVHGSVSPRLPAGAAVTVAVGIIGATVMPHAIYLHSGLTRNRVAARADAARARLIRRSNREVVIALALAGAGDMAMVILAAAAFDRTGHRHRRHRQRLPRANALLRLVTLGVPVPGLPSAELRLRRTGVPPRRGG